MHNYVLKMFDFLKNCIQFCKILTVFSFILLTLYWMQDLIGTFWNWFKVFTPIFDFFLDFGASITSGSVDIFSAVFEFKYLVVIALYLIFYLCLNLLSRLLTTLEDLYDSGIRLLKKYEETNLNKNLEQEQKKEQKKLKMYHIYLQTFVKKGIAHREFNVNLEEQNKILINHLLEKTGICPKKYQEGFLYTFYAFDNIDENIETFIKLFASKAPIDFLICVQLVGQDRNVETEELNTLIGLKILNKITMLANTAYRYSFNKNQRYKTSQLGVFQKGENNFEVHEFITKD